MKKVISIILCAALMIIMLVGCSQKETGTKSGEGGDKPVTIRYALWNKEQEAVMREIVKKFEETHPNIKVDVQHTPNKQYWTKIEAAASGGTMPDVFWMNGPRFLRYVTNDVLMPIDNIVNSENVDMSKFPQGLVDLYNYEGKQYAIPKDWDVTALWYNKELFDEAGVEYPTNEWTWDDMVAAARKITNADKGIYGIAAKVDTQEGTYNTIPASGGFILSEDRKKSGYNTQGNIEGIKIWIDLLNEGLSPSIEEMTDTDALEMFTSGNIGMIYSASWNVNYIMENENIKDKVDLAVLPKIKKRAVVIHGLGNVIYSGTEHPDEAAKLVKFLASKEANEMWAKSGVVIPAHKEVLDIWKSSYPNINLQAFVDELDYAYMYPSSLNTKWGKYQWEIYLKIWNQQISVEEGCKLIYDEMTKLLQE